MHTPPLGTLLGPVETVLRPVGSHFEPAAVAGAAPPVRAAAAFCLVVGVGAALLWRNSPFVDRSREASMARPLSALGYGVATHAVIAFVGVYLANKLVRYDPFGLGRASGDIGVGVGVGLVAVAGAVGFTVAGATVTDLLGDGDPRVGLVVGGLVAAAAAALASTAGAVLWFVVVSVGIGGAVRKWVHASAVAEIEAERAS